MNKGNTMEQRQYLQQIMLEKLTNYPSRNTPYTFHKNLLKMGHRPKCKMQNKKLLEDNIRKNMDDLEYGDDFLDIIPKTNPLRNN